MFDENQIVATRWISHNKDWLICHGYKFTKINDIIYVKAKDLPHGSKVKVSVICERCKKEFKVQYNTYLKAKNADLCHECAHRKTREDAIENNANEIIERAKQICAESGYKLIYDKDSYRGTNGKIKYICPVHGEQTVLLGNLLAGHKCDKCAREKNWEKCRLDQNTVINRIESINGNKLINPEDYIDAFENNLFVRCKCGNIFKTSLQNYKRTNTCRNCSNKESKCERRIREYLENCGITFVQEKRFEDCADKCQLPFDFFLPEHNMCIEYDGEHHYWNVFSEKSTESIKIHDKIKNEYCKKNNIKLLRIPYYKKNQIENILNQNIQVEDIV